MSRRATRTDIIGRAGGERRLRPDRHAGAASTTSPTPTARPFPTYRVCQLARKHVTVALSGDGGDESFGGYRRYRLHLMEERMRAALPQALRRPVFGLLGRAYPKARLGAARVPREDHVRSARARRRRGVFPLGVDPAGTDARAAVQRRAQVASCGGYDALRRVPPPRGADADTDDPLALIQYLDLQDVSGRRHQHQGRPREHGAFAGGARAADGPPAGRMAGHPAVDAEDPRPGGQVPAEEGDGAASAAARSSTGRRWASPCRWRAGSAGRSRSACAMPCSGQRSPRPAGSITAYLRHLVDAHQSGARDYSAPLWTLLMFEAFLRNVVDDRTRPRRAAPASRRGESWHEACASCMSSITRSRCTAAIRFARCRSCASSARWAGRRFTSRAPSSAAHGRRGGRRRLAFLPHAGDRTARRAFPACASCC